MIVLDTSAAFEFLADTNIGRRIAARLGRETEVHAPYLIDVELVQVLRRQVRLNILSTARAARLLEDFEAMRIVRYEHLFLVPRIWELRFNFTAYDACYLALTEALGATLLTRDEALAPVKLRSGEVELM